MVSLGGCFMPSGINPTLGCNPHIGCQQIDFYLQAKDIGRRNRSTGPKQLSGLLLAPELAHWQDHKLVTELEN